MDSLHFVRPQLSQEITKMLNNMAQPFPMEMLYARVGAVFNKDSAEPKGMALFYGEWWTSYLPRLEEEIGPEGPHTWTITPTVWGQKIIVTMSAFGGLLQGFSSGESEDGDQNMGTSSEAQAKKRVCAQVVQLGRYLYHAPRIYGRVEKRGNSYVFAEGEERRVIEQYYRVAGYFPFSISVGAPRPEPERPPLERPAAQSSRPQPAPRPVHTAPVAEPTVKVARAAIQQVQPRGAEPQIEEEATERQLAAVASLVIQIMEDEQGNLRDGGTARVNEIGRGFGIANLAAIDSARKADGMHLTKNQASSLIGKLQGHTHTTEKTKYLRTA